MCYIMTPFERAQHLHAMLSQPLIQRSQSLKGLRANILGLFHGGVVLGGGFFWFFVFFHLVLKPYQLSPGWMVLFGLLMIPTWVFLIHLVMAKIAVHFSVWYRSKPARGLPEEVILDRSGHSAESSISAHDKLVVLEHLKATHFEALVVKHGHVYYLS